MRDWIVEADIYRLRKAMSEAEPEGRARLAIHLGKAETLLSKLRSHRTEGASASC